jgi:hypothetical protein
MTNTTNCPAACRCRTVDTRSERELADNMLARCRCGEVFHQAHVTDRGPCQMCREEAAGERRGPVRIERDVDGGPIATFIVALSMVFAFGLGACATAAPRAVEVETVGTLAPSYRSIATAPVAKSTDLSIAYQAVSGDDDGPAVAAGGETVEAPEVVAKGGGLVAGGVR